MADTRGSNEADYLENRYKREIRGFIQGTNQSFWLVAHLQRLDKDLLTCKVKDEVVRRVRLQKQNPDYLSIVDGARIAQIHRRTLDRALERVEQGGMVNVRKGRQSVLTPDSVKALKTQHHIGIVKLSQHRIYTSISG